MFADYVFIIREIQYPRMSGLGRKRFFNISRLLLSWAFYLILFLLLLLPPAAICQSTLKPNPTPAQALKPRVLVFHSYHHGFSWTDNITNGIRSVFASQFSDIELIFEFLDVRRIQTEEYLGELQRLYRLKYANRKIDAIICSDDHALRFFLTIEQEVFSEVPAVFLSVSGYEPWMREGRQLTGAIEALDIKDTLDIALQLHPETEEVAVITDKTLTGRSLKVKAEKVFRDFSDRVDFTYLEDLTVEELEQRVSELSYETIVFLFIFTRDKAGRVFSHEENLERLVIHCDVPIYSVWEFYLGHGIAGGKLTSGRAEGILAAETVLRILRGEKASEIPLARSPNRYMFDYRQLERFGVKESRLPKDSIVINKPFSFYDEYKRLIWSVVSIIMLLVVIIAVLVGNIALRKRVEEKLRESEERYKSLFENNHSVMLLIEPESADIVDANPAACSFYGWTKKELVSKKITDINTLTGEQVFKEMERAKSEERRHFHFRHRLASGEVRYVEVYSGPITIHGRKLLYSIIHDITDRRLAESERERLEAQLQQAQKMEAVGTLAGGVAHDLNNILSGLVSYPELLLLDIPEDSPLRNPILAIKESGERAASVVQDLLTLARRGVAITDVVNLNDIIHDHMKSPEHHRLKAYHPGLEFRVDLNTELPNIMGSPVHLSKTVTNLVSNAAEAMPDVGKILISTRNQYIDRPIRGYEDVREGDYVVLSVVDSGIGISPEDLARVFEPFYTKKVMGRSGTGLGMAVVWGTVKDHNGYIDIQSTPGKGTRCDLYFPVTRKEPAEKRITVSIDEYLGSESILVVDDIKEQAEIACQLLTKLGYYVTTVSSGEEAIEYMQNNPADLLILDMIMDPGLDGLDTYKEILKIHPGQKAIIASGFSETERVKEAQRLGAGPYIKKPYVLEKIGKAVRAELDK